MVLVTQSEPTAPPKPPELVAVPQVQASRPPERLDPAKTANLTGREIGTRKYGWKVGYFKIREGKAFAYFRRELLEGKRMLTLVQVDDEHPLAPALVKHSALSVSVDLLTADDHDGKLVDISESSHEVRWVVTYLRTKLEAIGYRRR